LGLLRRRLLLVIDGVKVGLVWYCRLS
jgi:hypothetical protein